MKIRRRIRKADEQEILTHDKMSEGCAIDYSIDDIETILNDFMFDLMDSGIKIQSEDYPKIRKILEKVLKGESN